MHTIIDHYAGAGGWDLAAHELGAPALGVELMPEARQTRTANGLLTVGENVWDMDTQPHESETFVASPPCQAYSTAGKGAGRKALTEVLEVLDSDLVMQPEALREEALRWGDERVGLVLTPLTYALRYRPQYVALEQVPNVLPVWQAIARRLERSGYHGWVGVLNAEQYGVPQTRRRAILMAARGAGTVTPPTPTHSQFHPRDPQRLDPDVLPWISMATACGWNDDDLVGFPRREDGEGAADPVVLDGVQYRARDLFPASGPAQHLTSKGRSWKRWSFNDQSGSPYDPDWPEKRPSTTVATRDLVQNPGATANRFNGSTKSRNDGVWIDIHEAALLQSFPKDFIWAGVRTKQFLMAGNACPPLLARAVLTALWKKETP